jgi:L-fuculokinase
MNTDALIVLDIGKTNVKLALIDGDGRVLAEQRRPNGIVKDGLYPHHDTDATWDWMLSVCREFAQRAPQVRISAIVPVTHGATAALVDGEGLVLPILDYEAPLEDVGYDAVRPPYSATFSPGLPAGLNLGRQLAWLARRFPHEFARARHILMYPQYWAWRLSGIAAAEATSLGCHTDLWDPLRQRHSGLVARMGWHGLMPPVSPPWTALASIKPEVAAATGLPADCVVLCGIHDSNASLLRHLEGNEKHDRHTVLSTGTWLIAAAFGSPLERLREDRDMLANTNAHGQPVACMRFMGGREFATLAGPGSAECSFRHLEQLVARGTMALPCFAETGGPFARWRGRVDGPPPQSVEERYALASLYCALMTDYCLTALGSAGPIAVEGSFTANPHFGVLLAALRPQQTVTYSDDASGTTCGGWMLRYRGRRPERHDTILERRTPPGLMEYRRRWLAALGVAA